MQANRIDLHLRRPEDLCILSPIRDALRERGVEAALSVDPRGWPTPPPEADTGPVRCDVRVVVSDREAPLQDSEGKLVVVEGEIVVPDKPSGISEELEAAELVLVPGPARARSLTGRVRGPVVACGLPYLDGLLEDPAAARLEARRSLNLPNGVPAILLSCAGSEPGLSAVEGFGEGLLALAAAGPLLVVPASERGAPWASQLRPLARHIPALRLAEDAGPEILLGAVDGVVGELGPLTLAALALGLPTVLLEAPERPRPIPEAVAPSARSLVELLAVLETVVRADALPQPAAPRSDWAAGLLLRAGSSAARAVEEILGRLGRPASPASGSAASRKPEQAEPERRSEAPLTGGGTQSEDALLDQLEAQAGFGQTEEALARLRGHLDSSPTPRGWRLLATFHRHLGRLDEARSAVARAEALARVELARTLCERARSDVEADRMNEAQEAFEEARRLVPDLAAPWIGIGSLAVAGERHPEAEDAFREAIRRDDRCAQAWSGLGLALLGRGRADEALDALEQALDREPNQLAAIFGVVQAAFQTGRLASAERRVRACLELRPGNVDLAFTLAGLRAQLGDQTGAREMIERVELFRPDYPGIAELRAKLDVN
jgi:tetratricopeptide (TPR) repeat protein